MFASTISEAAGTWVIVPAAARWAVEFPPMNFTVAVPPIDGVATGERIVQFFNVNALPDVLITGNDDPWVESVSIIKSMALTSAPPDTKHFRTLNEPVPFLA